MYIPLKYIFITRISLGNRQISHEKVACRERVLDALRFSRGYPVGRSQSLNEDGDDKSHDGFTQPKVRAGRSRPT